MFNVFIFLGNLNNEIPTLIDAVAMNSVMWVYQNFACIIVKMRKRVCVGDFTFDVNIMLDT